MNQIKKGRLKFLCGKKGISMTRLSQLSGVSKTAISHVNGGGKFTNGTAYKITAALGITISELEGNSKGPSEFGKALKVARENAGLSQEQLSKMAGLSRTAIYQYETGRVQHPSAQIMSQINSVLEMFKKTEEQTNPFNFGKTQFAQQDVVKNSLSKNTSIKQAILDWLEEYDVKLGIKQYQRLIEILD